MIEHEDFITGCNDSFGVGTFKHSFEKNHGFIGTIMSNILPPLIRRFSV